MDPSSFLFFLLLLLHIPHLSLSHTPPPPPIAPDLILRTCTATTYVDLCLSSLESDPASSSAADASALSAILLALGAANASAASSCAAALAARSPDAALRGVLRACAGRYADARDALRGAADEVASENYDYAYLHVSGAMEYPRMCRDLFQQQGSARGSVAALPYPAEMGRREEGVVRLCTVVRDVIALLG